MKLFDNAFMLRIFIGENDKYRGRPLYEQIVLKAKKLNLAGITVTKGIMGFGADSRLHSSKILTLSEDLPIIIEIIDKKVNIDKLIPFLDKTVGEGLITLGKIKIIKYRQS